jgi:hypothetical protein
MGVTRMESVCSKCGEMQASGKVSNRKLFDTVVLYNAIALNIRFYAARIHIIFYSYVSTTKTIPTAQIQ